ncbi:hypothetical protein RR46_11084 [Papilio xuthus]|uniref:Uncharacterized protein n=1 Tax=Papilio xuthus TaxID=66420 RepID=A0A194PY60_PAPXU|nr:hypothetical protein RR46_11084 [Papilio xuthus]
MSIRIREVFEFEGFPGISTKVMFFVGISTDRRVVMSTCVVEEGRDEGGGEIVVCEEELTVEVLPERPRRDVLMSARGRRACSEQGPHPSSHLYTQHGTSHLWGANSGRRGWSRKRTSAPQMGNTQGSMPRVALVLRSRRSWPVAPQSYRRYVNYPIYFYRSILLNRSSFIRSFIDS